MEDKCSDEGVKYSDPAHYTKGGAGVLQHATFAVQDQLVEKALEKEEDVFERGEGTTQLMRKMSK